MVLILESDELLLELGDRRELFGLIGRRLPSDSRLLPIAPDAIRVIELQALIRGQRRSPSLKLGTMLEAAKKALAVAFVEGVEPCFPEPGAKDRVEPRAARLIRVGFDHCPMATDPDCFANGEPISPRSPRLQAGPCLLAESDNFVWVGTANRGGDLGIRHVQPLSRGLRHGLACAAHRRAYASGRRLSIRSVARAAGRPDAGWPGRGRRARRVSRPMAGGCFFEMSVYLNM